MCGITLVTAELLWLFFFYSFLHLSISKESMCLVDHHPFCRVSQLKAFSADCPGEFVFTCSCLIYLPSKHPLVSHQAGSAVALSVHGECYWGGLHTETFADSWVKLAQDKFSAKQPSCSWKTGAWLSLTLLEAKLHLSCLNVFMHPGLTSLSVLWKLFQVGLGSLGVGTSQLEIRAPWMKRGVAMSSFPYRLVLLEEPVPLHLSSKMFTAKAKVTDNLFLESLGEILIFRARRS